MQVTDARVGRWVVHHGKVAIIFRIGPDTLPPPRNAPPEMTSLPVPAGSAMVHYVDDKTGLTIGEEIVPLDALTRAALDDIPAIRRPAAPSSK